MVGSHILVVVVQYVALVTLFDKLLVRVLSAKLNFASNVSTTCVSGLAITFIFDE